MAYSKLHDTDHPIEATTAYNNGTGYTALTDTNIKSNDVANSFELGALLLTTAMHLFMHDGTVVQPVQSLDMAMVDIVDGQVITDMDDGSIVYNY